MRIGALAGMVAAGDTAGDSGGGGDSWGAGGGGGGGGERGGGGDSVDGRRGMGDGRWDGSGSEGGIPRRVIEGSEELDPLQSDLEPEHVAREGLGVVLIVSHLIDTSKIVGHIRLARSL